MIIDDPLPHPSSSSSIIINHQSSSSPSSSSVPGLLCAFVLVHVPGRDVSPDRLPVSRFGSQRLTQQSELESGVTGEDNKSTIQTEA